MVKYQTIAMKYELKIKGQVIKFFLTLIYKYDKK